MNRNNAKTTVSAINIGLSEKDRLTVHEQTACTKFIPLASSW